MTFNRNAVVSIILSAFSLVLSVYTYFLQPPMDIRLAASLISLTAFAVVIGNFKKHASSSHLLGFFLAMLSLGISLDHRFPAFPLVSLAMVLAFFSFKRYFRQWFSETTFIWADPFFIISSFAVYAFANVHYGYGWKGWVLPLLPMIGVSFFTMKDFYFNFGSLKYMKGRNMIHETGKAAPDFSLPDYDGTQVKLSDYSGKRDLLLMFVRSAWCPSCHIMLRTYQRNMEKFKEKNILLFAIGPDVSEVNKEMAMSMGIDFKVLSDEGQKTAMAYRVHLPVEVTGEQDAEGLPLPACFLLDKKGIIRYTSRPDRIGEFFAPETIFPVLESLN
jgi:peroxiredoxin